MKFNKKIGSGKVRCFKCKGKNTVKLFIRASAGAINVRNLVKPKKQNKIKGEYYESNKY